MQLSFSFMINNSYCCDDNLDDKFLYCCLYWYDEIYCIILSTNELFKSSNVSLSNLPIWLKSFDVLKNQNFIEYPKLGFQELNKIIKKISNMSGGILLIDYGYLKPFNENTIQAVMKNKKLKMNNLQNYIGKTDITYLVNFNLLKEFFIKNNLKVKNIVSQKFFLETMGIIERAKIIEKNMSDQQRKNMYITLKRLLHRNSMGELFKVIFAYNFKKNNFLGFD